MNIAMGADHAGFEQKELLKNYLVEQGFTVHDKGCFSEERVDYPDFAQLVSRSVATGEADFGVLVCGTGIGMAMAANKIHGIRAANVSTAEFAQLAREHNNANVVTLSGRFVDVETNKAILDAFLNTEFAGGRHECRVSKIMELE
ncbi:MAG: ribose 5-phosphate isomerase B [Eggerthellaceae bacterium]|nr:ribose 5-phosphate isomerase B [Eggerthellaceae bacterium]